ncbi:hypothetical protein B0H14DRAFT_2622092 [Mycena olivaceomarginata]|nr:hypothetical protein B0H14DRAFT_2622092 [Mycena olivaceomarginata]
MSQDHSLMLLVLRTTSFTWPDYVGDRYGPSFFTIVLILTFVQRTLSYGGDDPDSKFQCLLGHVKHLRRRQFALSRNTATSIPDNMKVGVNICIIKNPGDSLVMPEVETRPIDFAKSEIQSRMQNRQYERQKKGIKRP